MDYVPTPAVLRAIVRAIEGAVLPQVEDTYASAQLWASTGLLGNLANELEREGAETHLSIGDDVDAFLAAVGFERALDGEDTAAAAAAISEDLEGVIAGHATLHYRRAVAGFGGSK